ncbi:MAG: Wzz/FepE/Etk N-terminal domain-containing protein [Bacillota bacterium]
MFSDSAQVDEISLIELFGVMRKRFKLIMFVVLAAIIITALATFFVLIPQYQSNTTLMVGKPLHKASVDLDETISYQQIQTNRLLVSTYGEIAKSRLVLDSVIESLDLEMHSSSLRQKIDVSLVKNTEIIQLTVTDKDPVLAAVIANQLAQAFSEQATKIMNVENIQVIDEAIPSKRPFKPSTRLNLAISAVLGLMAGLLLAFVLEFFDTSIKSPEDVEKYLGLPVIGILPATEGDKG